MFEKILVANRGEIAVRIIRACKELNIRTVAVYSEVDANSMHVQLADEAICIGKAASSESYLRIDRIISAAEITDVDAIHPGYGFLSENAHFADVCENCNIRFIGPSSRAMNALQDKAVSRALAKKAGVPTPPGSEGVVEQEQEAIATAKRIGYPVIIKAIAGGGGRGMRVAHNDISLVTGYHTARSEAEKAFGNSGVYIEKFIENKFKDLRKKMGKAAIRIAEMAHYTNAGTVAFLVDNRGSFYFLEVNKRIQVEHAITEEVTGVDLVKQQILIALGEPLKLSQNDLTFKGHAIECRINAEDPFDDFRPCPGRIEMYYQPGGRGIRLDSHVYAGYTIPSNYDSLISKLVTSGKDRREAMDKMSRALGEYMITGIKTTIPFEQAILQDPNFRRGVYSTNFVDQLLGGARRELIEEKA